MKKFLVAASLLLAAAACGKRGRLDYPDGSLYPVRTYPAPHGPEQHGTDVRAGKEQAPSAEGLMDAFEQLEREADEK